MKVLTTLALLVLCTTATRAHAQAPWESVARDYDAEGEEFSEFWERALSPRKDKVQSLLAEAKTLSSSSREKARDRAVVVLRMALKLDPSVINAWWELGRLEQRRNNPKGCVDALRRVFELEPRFQPKGKSSWQSAPSSALDLRLGNCLAETGNYDEAIAQFKRILSRGPGTATVYRRIGEAYMALGRLSRAIEYLETAHNKDNRNREILYALAVAYDRDPRPGPSRDAMIKAMSRDRNLSQLSSKKSFIPKSDLYYYLGLAHGYKKNREWAMVYFRRYLAEAKTSPWRARAKKHLAAATRRVRVPRLSGTATFDRGKVEAASFRMRAATIEQCLAGHPNMLLRAKVTRLSKGRSVGHMARAEGVIVLVDYAYDIDPAAAERAVACARKAARQITLPAPVGQAGAYAVAEFQIIGP